jgi:hypothetical protein
VTTKHQRTREEEAYGQLLEEIWEKLSEPAHAVLGEAQSAAYAENMVRSYCFQPEEYEETLEKMRLAAAKLTEREHKLLANLWRAALAAAASIDSEDFETLAGYRVYRGDLHRYYRMLSGMVEDILEEKMSEKREAELQKELAEQEPEDFSDLPF